MTYDEEFFASEATAQYDQCGDEVPMSDAIELGERIGPDLIPYPLYLCFACADANDQAEDIMPTHVTVLAPWQPAIDRMRARYQDGRRIAVMWQAEDAAKVGNRATERICKHETIPLPRI